MRRPEGGDGRFPPQPSARARRDVPQGVKSRDVLAATGWDREAVRDLVLARSGWSCDLCTVYLPGRIYSLQHRRARGKGGRAGRILDTPWNLVTLCGDGVRGCHGWIETTGEGRRWGYDHGFAIRGEAQDPVEVPIFRHRREWVIPSVRDDDGVPVGLWVPADPIPALPMC